MESFGRNNLASFQIRMPCKFQTSDKKYVIGDPYHTNKKGFISRLVAI